MSDGADPVKYTWRERAVLLCGRCQYEQAHRWPYTMTIKRVVNIWDWRVLQAEQA